MNSFCKWRPKTTGEYVITIGLILNLVGNVTHEMFFKDVDPVAISERNAIVEWGIRLFRDIGFATGFGGMVVVGIRNLRNEAFSLKKLIMPVAGVLVLVSMSIGGFYTSALMKSTFENLEMLTTDTEKAENYYKEKINNPNISMPERSKYSKYYAKVKYEKEGTIIEYLTPDGVAVAYQPTEEQIKIRKEMIESKIKLKWAQESLKKAGYLWAIIAIGSILLGFIPNRKREHLTTASTADA